MKLASLNHVYRVIWSHVLRTWVVVAENAKGRGKSSSRKLVAAALALTASVAHAGPTGAQVTTGAGSISQTGSTTTINQSSQNLSINWLTFNVAPQETVNFVQPSASAVAVNRISGNSGSVILGHVNANGQVYLINPNGVLFGEGAQVNVGGLVASTLDINDSNVNGSTRSFSGSGLGSVINQGTINSANGGYVALLGNHVGNQGTITAQLGTLALGAGNAVTLSFGGNSLVHMQVDQSVLHSLAENGGLIQADGGQVIMTAGAKNTLLASIVNNTGVIEARTVQNHNGTIELLGGMTAGTVNVGGTLDASAPVSGDGGAIETSAAKVKVASGTNITTLAAHGKTGNWLVDPQDFTVAASGGDITGATLSSELATTNTTLQSSAGANSGSGNVNINDVVSWSANTTLTLTASNYVNFNANVTATGNSAGLVINPNTSNGSETASGTGVYVLNNGASITLSGATPSLSIAGQAYTVINTLGTDSYDPTAPSLPLSRVAGTGYMSGHFALGTNIDATTTSSWYSGQGFYPIGTQGSPFNGTFDGLGHTVSNLYINMPGTSQLGMFGTIGATGVVQNLGLVGGSITGGGYGVGALAYNNLGTIRNAYASSTVTGVGMVGGLVAANHGTIVNSYATGNVTETATNNTNAGGLVGANYGTISNSYATGNVSGSNNIGGLVGVSFSGSIAYSNASGSVSGHSAVGGLVGVNDAAIDNSYATGNVSSSGSFAGGLVGSNSQATITNSYATGNVAGTSFEAGLVGADYKGTILNTYAVGSVTGSSAAGLVSYSVSTTVTNGYWNTETTGQLTSSSGGTGLTTAQMQNMSNFAGFNFSTTPGATGNSWVMVDPDGTLNNAGYLLGATFPMLTSEYSTTISNSHQLQLMNLALGANYNLAANIDASATITRSGNSIGGIWNADSGFAPIGNVVTPFTGTFDGHGHTISNLTIDLSYLNNAGLFGYTGGSSVISNVGVVAASVTAGNNVGELVGYNSGSITNSYATRTTTTGIGGSSAKYVGGLVGYNNGGSISSSYSTGDVLVNGGMAGGLIGYNNGGTITNSYASGNVTGTILTNDLGGLIGYNVGGKISASSASGVVTGGGAVGGLIGYNSGGTITGSHASGAVQSGNLDGAGGLVGYNVNATISDSFATGDVTGFGNVGGLVGANYGSSISNSYSQGAVNGGSLTGGLVGNNSGSIDGSYADGNVSGTTNFVGGLVGQNNGSITNSHALGSVTGALFGNDIGGLVGYNVGGSVSNSYAAGAISGYGNAIGGLVGRNDGSIDGSHATGTTNGVRYVGGLVGEDFGNISNSYATGNVTGFSHLGGLAGSNYGGTIAGSFATGSVGAGAYYSTSSQVGGLVGLNYGKISTSYATGSVSGTTDVGGLVGRNYTPIGDSFARGSVNGGTNVGGLVGYNYGGSINTSYAAGSVSGTFGAGALVGSNAKQGAITYSFYDSSTNVGLSGIGGQADVAGIVWGMSTANMQQQANFTGATAANGNVNPGWDFVSGRVWNSSPTINGGYPYLCNIASACVAQAVTLYVDPVGGSSIYGAAANVSGYVLDTSPVIGSGFVINDASPSGTVNWSGIPSSSSNVGSYLIAYSGGLSVSNPSFTLAASNVANWNVTPATLTITGQTAVNKVYNGSNTATLTGGTLTGLINGDQVTLTPAGTFPSKNVGNGLGITVADGLSGTAASNYTLVQPTGLTANITPLSLTVNASGGNRVYNGGVNDTVTLSSTGIVAGDVVNLASTSANFASKNVGTGVQVSVSGISLSGTDAGNYTLASTSAITSANITPATLTVSGETAANKVYNGNVGATLSGGSLVGVTSGDSVSLTQAGSFASKNVGTGVTITAADSISGTGAGNYTLVQPTGLSANITPATLTVTGESASSRVYSGGTVATLTGGTLSGVISGDSVTLGQIGSFATKNVGNGIVVTAADTLNGTDAGNYTLVQPARLTANITPLAITATATGNNMVYNGTTSDTVTLTSTGVIAGDTVTFTDSAATLASKNVGTNVAVNVTGISMTGADAGNYTLSNRNASTTANISPAPLTVTGEIAANKVYNGSTATTLSGGQLAGLFAGDHLTLTQAGSFVSKNAGTGVAVNVSDTVSGNSATNYVLVQPTNVVGNITQATITVAAAGTSMVYNGTVNDTVRLTSSGIVAGDVVGIADASASFAGKNVGTNLAVTVSGIGLSGTDAGNYKLASTSATTSASITPAPLTVSGETAANKVYNGNTAASLSGGSLVGVLAGDTVTLNQAGSFASKNAGTNVAVTIADTLSGTSATNYAIVQPAGVTANITPLSVTVTGQTATNRVYNGTTVDALTGGTLVGAISGDAVTLVQTGTLASKNVGTGIAVTVSDSLSGTSAGNYTLVQPTGVLHANITPLAITVAAAGTNMVYNGTVIDSVTLTGTGVAAGDAVSFTDTSANFASKNVGTGVRVSVSGISMTGTDAGNYTLSNTTASTSANITAAPLTVTGETAATRTYNGTTTATLMGGSLVGLIGSDSVSLNQAGAFTSKNAGVGVAVTTTDSISGANASNYKLVQPTGVTGTITPAALTVTGQRATNIVYNGSTIDPLTVGHLQGLLAGDMVTLISLGNFISPNIGTAIPVIVSDSLSGASAGNYILTQPTGLSANITHP